MAEIKNMNEKNEAERKRQADAMAALFQEELGPQFDNYDQ